MLLDFYLQHILYSYDKVSLLTLKLFTADKMGHMNFNLPER